MRRMCARGGNTDRMPPAFVDDFQDKAAKRGPKGSTATGNGVTPHPDGRNDREPNVSVNVFAQSIRPWAPAYGPMSGQRHSLTMRRSSPAWIEWTEKTKKGFMAGQRNDVLKRQVLKIDDAMRDGCCFCNIAKPVLARTDN